MIFINKILIIEDDLALANGLKLALKETKNTIVNNIKSTRNELENNKFNTNKIVMDNFIFDFDNLEYYVNNELIELSKTEQKLLEILIENKVITLSIEILINKIWIDNLNYVDENVLFVSIKRLRDKLEEN